MNEGLLEMVGPRHTTWQRAVVYDQGRHGKPSRSNKGVWAPVRERQKELREAVENGHQVLGAYLRDALKIGSEEIGAPPFPRPRVTPEEFRRPPPELEWELHGAWTTVTPRLASRPLFWLLCHVAWIEDSRFGETGHRLTQALTAGGGRSGIEGETRTFLRRTGGIPHERGKTTVFSDCPLARAWWRCRIAEEVAAHGTLTRDDAHFALRANHQAWERLAMLSVKQLVIINQPIARATVVAGLSGRLRNGGNIGPADVKEEAQVCARAGLRQSFLKVASGPQ